MARLFDTHAHYTDARLRDTELLSQALAGDIAGLVTVALDLADSEACIALAAAHESVWASAGIHPHECGKAGALDDAMLRLRMLLKKNKAVAIGEIGLDYHYDFSDRETQMRFSAHRWTWRPKRDFPSLSTTERRTATYLTSSVHTADVCAASSTAAASPPSWYGNM